MSISVTVSGASELRARLERARVEIRARVKSAVTEAVRLVWDKAQGILDREVYGKAGRKPFEQVPDKSDSDALFNKFRSEITSLSATAAEGTLFNDSPHAAFLEFGTDDEGTGQHFVPSAGGGVLAFINPMTGAVSFSKGHYVKELPLFTLCNAPSARTVPKSLPFLDDTSPGS